MKTNYLNAKTPIACAIGVFIILLLTNACESEKTPAQVTEIFWKAMAKNDLSLAKKYCNSASQTVLDIQVTAFNQATFDLGKIIILDDQATVETLVSPTINKKSTFTTFLIKEDKHWKVDCQQSLKILLDNPFKAFFKQLNSLGESLNKQLEQQIPLIEKEINSFGNELKQQIDQFGKELKKAFPPDQTDSYQGTI